uniref:Uncharacterized protein n=1 Tax=Arundo donax TaxID=35708 RepID=A0A0A9AC39_ARUDO
MFTPCSNDDILRGW